MSRLHFPNASMKAKKLIMLFPSPNICPRRYHRFEGDTATHLLLLPRCIIELSGIRTYSNISRMSHVTLTFSDEGSGGTGEDTAGGSLVDGLVAVFCLVSRHSQFQGPGEVPLDFPDGH